MTHIINYHVGKRVQRRRRLLGQTLENLAKQVDVSFQQLQKYESGANRISAVRLFELSRALHVPVQYFYEGLAETNSRFCQPDAEIIAPDVLTKNETIDLIRAYYALEPEPRKHLLSLTKSLRHTTKTKLCS